MHFLSQGDFNFPFDFLTYWIKHAFIWSYQSGTPNPDGLIRLPGRFFNFIMFLLFGNMGASYFYVIAPLVICFISFFFFAKHFLHVKRTSILIIGSLFFALNPIFLGNVAKIGLVLAAAMLPFCLLAIKAAFEKRQFRYFLLFIVCINISFLHPYTFTVNFAVAGLYLAYMLWRHRDFFIDNFFKFVMVGVVALLLNMYFVLPMMSMGSVSKDMISTNITPKPIDYTALVGISNTGNFFTGFSLSKNVFLDFDFYNSTYQNVYFFGVFLMYAVLLGLFLYIERTLKPAGRRQLAVLFGAFLVLIALAATTVMHIDTLIKFLISMPGGWAFRSPLKWQLYIPLALFGIMVLLLAEIRSKRVRVASQTILLVSFVIMNGYLFVDLYRKILVPRTLTNFSGLMQTNMDHQNVLFVNNGDCMDYLRTNTRVNTELNQVFTSKNTQLKHVLVDDIDGVNLGSYAYMLTCKENTSTAAIVKGFGFNRTQSYADNNFRLYKNQRTTPQIFAPTQVYGITAQKNIRSKFDFVTKQQEGMFNFALAQKDAAWPSTRMVDVFETVMPKAVNAGTVTTMVGTEQKGERKLYVRDNGSPLYYRQTDNGVTFSAAQEPGMQQFAGYHTGLPLPAGQPQTVSLSSKEHDYKNLISNPSFEEGLWQKEVDDCYDYDDQPDIAMRLDEQQGSHGKQSLQLDAKQHIACTGPGPIAVKEGQHYLISFDYQSLEGKYAGYYVSYDDPLETNAIVRMQKDGESWNAFSQELAVPKGATRMTIKLYAYPHTYGEKTSTVHYDNVSLINIPPLQDRFYVMAGPAATISQPERVEFTAHDPTRKTVRVAGATDAFYLADSDSYHPLWQLVPNGTNTPLAENSHIRLNNTMNAWYVDTPALCKDTGACTKNKDGSYDIDFTIVFQPQKSFYYGALISGVTAAGCLVYFIISTKKARKQGGGYRR